MKESTPANEPMDWNQRYREKNTPWDVNVPSRQLVRVLDGFSIEPSSMLELGCGTGTDALLLAQRGFSVMAIDLLVQLQEFHFEGTDIGDQHTRPLGWSALWRRKGEHG